MRGSFSRMTKSCRRSSRSSSPRRATPGGFASSCGGDGTTLGVQIYRGPLAPAVKPCCKRRPDRLGRGVGLCHICGSGDCQQRLGNWRGLRGWACLMGICGDIAGPASRRWPAKVGRDGARASGAASRCSRCRRRCARIGALGGCTSNDSGELLIDPGRYAVYKCDDFAARWKIVSAREKELRGLMERAGQSSGGAVVGSLAYRAEYDAVISDERMLQRTAAGKKLRTWRSRPRAANPGQGRRQSAAEHAVSERRRIR